ncbi:MAG: C10 family peptidase [Vulcanimicrobiota bacterium]
MKTRFLKINLFIFLIFISILIGFSGCGGGSGGGNTESSSNTLLPNTTYNWQVEAVDEQGNRSIGPEWAFTTKDTARTLSSGNVDADTARLVALRHLNQQKSRKEIQKKYGEFLTELKSNPIRFQKPLTDRNGKTLAHVFELHPAGYVVVSANTALTPIIAYSFTSRFNWENTPQNVLLSILALDMKNRYEVLEKGLFDRKKIARNEELWQNYMSNRLKVENNEKTLYGPLFTFETWDQTTPYNDLCPMDPTTDERTIVGCVATAMSQHCVYLQEPSSISFTSSDNFVTNTRNIYVNATNASMASINYNNGNPSDSVKAQLSFACGVAVEMDYTSDLSLAYVYSSVNPNAYDILKNRFGFDDIDFYSGFARTESMNNITLGLPVYLAIYGNRGGHAINVDGYDNSNGYFHMNMGWAGETDGWYDIASGMPEDFDTVGTTLYNIRRSSAEQPQPPENMVLSAKSSDQVLVTWTNISSDSQGVNIERKADGEDSFVLAGQVGSSTTSFTDTGLNANTNYTYRLRAYKQGIFSVYTSEISVATFGANMPSSPEPSEGATGVSITPTLKWASAEGAVYYNIYLWQAAGSKPDNPSSAHITTTEYKPQ